MASQPITPQAFRLQLPDGSTEPFTVSGTQTLRTFHNSPGLKSVIWDFPDRQLALALAPGAIVEPAPPPPPPTPPVYVPPGQFTSQVYWNDFNTPTSLADWTIGSGNVFGYAQGETIAGGKVLSAFTSNAVSLDGVTNLVITTAKSGSGYTTGFLTMSNIQKTTASHSFKYGTFMSRIMLPKDAGGEWTAFWALTLQGGTEEFDFQEAILGPQGNANQNDNVYYGTLHGTSHDVGSHEVNAGTDITGVYHEFGGTIDQSGNCTWWFDGKSVATQAAGSNFMGKDWFLILNNTVGGWNNGTVSGVYPNQMLVDWVGVWQ